MSLFQKYGALSIGILLSIFIIFYSSDFAFFWDSIQLGSQHADWYYSKGFSHFLLPSNLDSGHFPLFGFYLAGLWALFGKSLMVSHLAMLPFLVGSVYYMNGIGQKLTDFKFGGWFVFLLFCNPYFLGQSVLVSPDVVLVAALLMSIHACLTGSKWQLLFSTVILALISQRGLLVVIALGLWILYLEFKDEEEEQIKLIYYLIPGIALASFYQLIHFLSQGWVGYHDASPWAESFQNVDSIKLLMKNAGVFGWRLIDYGNIALWLGLIALLRKKQVTSSQFAVLIILLVGAFAIVIIPKVGLLNHRYFLPIILIGMIWFLDLLYQSSISFKKIWILTLGVILLSGNFWKYRKGVAMGWDSTLGHLPYYDLLDDALAYIHTNEINLEEVGTAFPAKNKIGDIYLSDEEGAFTAFDLDNDKYILYSNVMNDFNKDHFFELENLWIPVFKKEKGNICMILYRRQ